MKEVFIIVICCILIFVIFNKDTECLSSRPSENSRAKMAQQILNNKDMFNTGKNQRYTLPDIKEKMSWIDAITYEDLRKLSMENKLNMQNIVKVL